MATRKTASKMSADPAHADAAPSAARLPAIRVTCGRPGFRRGGRPWPAGPVEVPVSEFTAEQLDQIRSEPLLTVDDIELGA